MELIADILLVAGALGASLYCFVLSRRLKRFTDLEQGVGGAVAVLSAQADELKKSLDAARTASDRSGDALRDLTERAQSVAQRLELMMASMHDVIADEDSVTKTAAAPQGPVELPDEAPGDADPKSDAAEKMAEPAATPPEGVMFFRHARPQDTAAT